MKINIDTKWLASIRGLNDSVRLSLYDAIFDYVGGKDVMVEGDAKVAFEMIRPMLDTHRKKPKKEQSLFDESEFRSDKLIAVYS